MDEHSRRQGIVCFPLYNIGLFMISLRVDSLESTLKRLSKDKTPVWSGPVNLDRKVWGMQRACVVQGPGRSLVCIYEDQ